MERGFLRLTSTGVMRGESIRKMLLEKLDLDWNEIGCFSDFERTGGLAGGSRVQTIQGEPQLLFCFRCTSSEPSRQEIALLTPMSFGVRFRVLAR